MAVLSIPAVLALGLAVLAGCSPDPVAPDDADDTAGTASDDTATADPSDAYFPTDRVLEVAITLDAADWDALRHETRNVLEVLAGDCLAEPFDSPYTWFPATVSVDGEVLEGAGVRKKGLLGSESSEKPALKVDLSEFGGKGTVGGLTRLTFNNGVQDPTLVHQCLGYGVFEAAGLPYSRCAFARVTVNGEDLGPYVHVESVTEGWLARHFDDPTGNLYEGTLSDFREGWTGTFERKTNEDDPDRSDLDAVVAVLDRPDGEVVAALDEVVDLDRYLRFWATEVLLGHWDGYAGNTNNFFVYADPSDGGRFHFAPWGIDALLVSEPPFGEGQPTSVVASAALPRRLYLLDETRGRYLGTLRDLLDTAWDEAALQAEVDRMAALLAPVVPEDDAAAWEIALDGLRAVIDGRRDAVLAEVDAGGSEWTAELRGSPCLVQVGSVRSTFATTWGSLASGDLFGSGEAVLEVVYDGWSIPFSRAGAVAGEDEDGNGVLAVGGLYAGDESVAIVAVWTFDRADLADGAVLPVDWRQVQGYLAYVDPETDWAVVGWLGEGALSFDEAGTGTADAVTGGAESAILAGSE